MRLSRKEMINVIRREYWRDYVGREDKLDELTDEEISEIYRGIIAQINYVSYSLREPMKY